jgi:hypothetical protein
MEAAYERRYRSKAREGIGVHKKTAYDTGDSGVAERGKGDHATVRRESSVIESLPASFKVVRQVRIAKPQKGTKVTKQEHSLL